MKKVPIIFFFLIFVSCKLNSENENLLENKKEGEKIMNIFFNNIVSNNFKENKKFLSKSFLDYPGTKQFEKDQNLIKIKLGNITNINLLYSETTISTKINSFPEYIYEYNIEREKKNSIETYFLIKENDSLKIKDYKIEYLNE
ncbi:MAG TPA: hypothetical protein VL022_02025 [Moheibacter sp.]|nr:hypothetical protein [Moheibacter sp.]